MSQGDPKDYGLDKFDEAVHYRKSPGVDGYDDGWACLCGKPTNQGSGAYTTPRNYTDIVADVDCVKCLKRVCKEAMKKIELHQENIKMAQSVLGGMK